MAYKYTQEIEKALTNFEKWNKCTFTLRDLFYTLDDNGKEYNSFMTVFNRFLKEGRIVRLVKGVYALPNYRKYRLESEMLAYLVSRLRGYQFTYLTMENVLSSWSIISQQLRGHYTFMTTGRSGTFVVGNTITLEFIHTSEKIDDYENNFYYDVYDGLVKALPLRAFKDMLKCKRSTLDLVNMDELKEVCEQNGWGNVDHYIALSKTYSSDYPFFSGHGA